jgi:hypothetical protein
MPVCKGDQDGARFEQHVAWCVSRRGLAPGHDRDLAVRVHGEDRRVELLALADVDADGATGRPKFLKQDRDPVGIRRHSEPGGQVVLGLHRSQQS